MTPHRNQPKPIVQSFLKLYLGPYHANMLAAYIQHASQM